MFKKQIFICTLLLSLGTIRTQEKKLVVKKSHKTNHVGHSGKVAEYKNTKGEKLIQLTRVNPPLFDAKKFQQLINEGANLTVTNGGETALISAINENKIEAVEMLIKAGDDVNRQTGGLTPLIHAAKKNRLQITKLLLATPGIRVNAKSKQNKETALFTVICSNSNSFTKGEQVARLLIAAGAAVNTRCRATSRNKGVTALWKVKHNKSWVRMLIEAGADVNLQYADGSDTNNTVTIFDKVTPKMKAYIEQQVKERKDRKKRKENAYTLPKYELPENNNQVL